MEVRTDSVELRTANGSMSCHLARPSEDGRYPAIVVAMEAWGVNEQIKRTADRIAAEGFVAIVTDLYHRQPDNLASYNDLAKAFGLMATLRDDEFVADIGAAIDYLATLDEVRPEFGITGFCLGGTVSFVAACRDARIHAAAPFYGAGMLMAPQHGGPARADYIPSLRVPVLGFFGGLDAFIPASDVEKLRETLMATGKAGEIVLYPDADHGFMNEDRPSYHSARAAEAWTRMIAFFKQHLKNSR